VTLPLFLAVAVGGYAAAGAANAINMVIDRDIDQRMRRTTARPTVTRRISWRNALAFAFALEILSFTLLSLAANVLTAALALAGLLFYVFIYTLLLKRRTWHNIVIGGAAGAFPPLVGWAAVTGSLSVFAWTLFAIIFVWTPVHFWALALLIKDDYASAGVPMLPCVKGDRATVVQIALYTVVTVAVTLAPFFTAELHAIYLAGAIVLNVILAVKAAQLYREVTRPRASSLFHYSMLYLALLFLVMAIDRALA
jgi:protoheme IX farnesyltransferase